MATQTQVTTICDMPHRDEPSGMPVTVMFDGNEYTVDLCAECAQKMILPLIKNGRKVGFKYRHRSPKKG
jgi:hypothetical protein